MKRMFYLLALFCAVGIGGYRIVQQNIQLKNHEERIFNLRTDNGMGTGVYAIRDIKVGEMVTTTDIETRPIAVNKMPDHIICRAADVIGRRPHYGIEKGQLLSMFDFQTASEVYGDIKKTERANSSNFQVNERIILPILTLPTMCSILHRGADQQVAMEDSENKAISLARCLHKLRNQELYETRDDSFHFQNSICDIFI